jgi:hypothetical protein
VLCHAQSGDIEETPFHLRNNVERELNKRLEQEIIERIEGNPTSWVSPIVTPSKQISDEILLLGKSLKLRIFQN